MKLQEIKIKWRNMVTWQNMVLYLQLKSHVYIPEHLMYDLSICDSED